MNPKDKILVEIATLMRYLADLIEQLVDKKTDLKVDANTEIVEQSEVVAKPKAVEKTETVAKPKTVEEGKTKAVTTQHKKVTMEQVRKVLGRKIDEGFDNDVTALIIKYGRGRLSKVKESDYEKLLAKAEALTNA